MTLRDKILCIILAAMLLMIIVFLGVSIVKACEGAKAIEEYGTNFQYYTLSGKQIDNLQFENGMFYLVDKNTDVTYLYIKSYYRGALTPLLNSDGTPILFSTLTFE